MHWKFEKSGLYTTKSMYRLLPFEGVVSKRLQKLRKNKMPMKLKVFLWLALQNRLQTGEALKRTGNVIVDARCVEWSRMWIISFLAVLFPLVCGAASRRRWVRIGRHLAWRISWVFGYLWGVSIMT